MPLMVAACVIVLCRCLVDVRVVIGLWPRSDAASGVIRWIVEARGRILAPALRAHCAPSWLLISRYQAHSRAAFSYLSGGAFILPVTKNVMCVWGVPMCALCDPLSSEWPARVSQHLPLPGRGDLASSAGYHGGAAERVGASLPPRCRMLAAGVAVSVALCLAWAGTARIMSVPAIPGSPAVRAMALVRFAGDGEDCLQAPGRDPGRVPGLDLVRRGIDGLRQQLARMARAPFTGPGVSPGSAPADRVQSAEGATLIRAPGAHRAITAADAACLLTYRGSLVRHPPPSSWRASAPARFAIRTLAVRTPTPWGHARLKRAKPMAEVNTGGMERPGAASADPGQDGIRLLSEPGPGDQDDLAGALPPGVFSGIPPPGCAVAGAERPSLAAGPPVRRCKACGDIGGSGGPLGCGDRASLPGRPARYRVIWLVCARCGSTTPRLFYDERDLPVCASSADAPHGPMELQR